MNIHFFCPKHLQECQRSVVQRMYPPLLPPSIVFDPLQELQGKLIRRNERGKERDIYSRRDTSEGAKGIDVEGSEEEKKERPGKRYLSSSL